MTLFCPILGAQGQRYTYVLLTVCALSCVCYLLNQARAASKTLRAIKNKFRSINLFLNEFLYTRVFMICRTAWSPAWQWWWSRSTSSTTRYTICWTKATLISVSPWRCYLYLVAMCSLQAVRRVIHLSTLFAHGSTFSVGVEFHNRQRNFLHSFVSRWR